MYNDFHHCEYLELRLKINSLLTKSNRLLGGRVLGFRMLINIIEGLHITKGNSLLPVQQCVALYNVTDMTSATLYGVY